MNVETRCPVCNKSNIISVPDGAYNLWRSGTLIQEALPMLGEDQREMLISGICPTCWDKMFSKSDSVDSGEDEDREY